MSPAERERMREDARRVAAEWPSLSELPQEQRARLRLLLRGPSR